MENNLPKGWAETNLEELQTLVIGGDWGIEESEINEDYLKCKVIRGTDFKNWNDNKTSKTAIRKIKKSSVEKRQLKTGDIVIEVSGGGPDQPVGRTIIIDQKLFEQENLPMVCSNFFRKVTLSNEVNSCYVNYYLAYAYSEGLFNDIQTHTTNLRNLRVDEYLQSKVLLAPYAEQQRIVAKLDTILKRVNDCKTRLDKIPTLLKNFRQSVLAAAVSGELTKEWREKNKVQSVTSYKEFEKKSFKGNDDLPETWSWMMVEDYLINLDRGRVPVSQEVRKMRQGNYPYYGATGIIDGIDGYTHEGEFILLSEDGMNLIYRTKPQAFIAEGKIWVNNHAHVLTSKKGFENKYSMYCFNTIDITPFLTGIDQVKLTQKNLNNILLPIPPQEEQKEIVRKVEELFHFADSIEARYQKAKAWFDKIPQAILAKAFRGELVPQDEKDEHASLLLEKIRSEKANTTKATIKRTSKPANGSQNIRTATNKLKLL